MGQRDHRRIGNILEKVEPQLERENRFEIVCFRDDKIVLDSVTSTVADWHIDRCTPSRDHRSARWGYISMYPCCRFMVRAPRRADSCSSWAGPGTTWNSHAAPNTGTVRRLANLFPFVREFTEVILLRPRQAQRSIALGNLESRCTVACSAPTGGSLLQRVISPSQERHRRVHGCEVNPSWTRSWRLSTKLLVRCDFKRGCLALRFSPVFWKGLGGGWASQLLFTDASKPLAGFGVNRTCNVTCGAKYHRTHINTVKTKCACAKKRQYKENDDRGKHHYTPRRQTVGRQSDIDLGLQSFARAIPDVFSVLGHF